MEYYSYNNWNNCLIRKLNFIKMEDVIVSSVSISHSIGRYGNFFNMKVFGEIHKLYSCHLNENRLS